MVLFQFLLLEFLQYLAVQDAEMEIQPFIISYPKNKARRANLNIAIIKILENFVGSGAFVSYSFNGNGKSILIDSVSENGTKFRDLVFPKWD